MQVWRLIPFHFACQPYLAQQSSSSDHRIHNAPETKSITLLHSLGYYPRKLLTISQTFPYRKNISQKISLFVVWKSKYYLEIVHKHKNQGIWAEASFKCVIHFQRTQELFQHQNERPKELKLLEIIIDKFNTL